MLQELRINHFVSLKASGTYALLLQATTAQSIMVGRLGQMHVQPGYYVYVGSAFGSGGLAARIGRHLRDEKRLHWHIDYLRQVATITEVWYTIEPVRRECEWADQLRRLPGASIPLAGFGSSDCGCASHLVWVARYTSGLSTPSLIDKAFKHRTISLVQVFGNLCDV